MLIVYTDTGQITQTVNDPIPPNYTQFLDEQGMNYLEHPDGDVDYVRLYGFQYVVDGKLCERPLFSLPERVVLSKGETVRLTLPSGCTLLVDDQEFQIEEDFLELEGDMEAEYTITVQKWPYVTFELKVSVHENPTN